MSSFIEIANKQGLSANILTYGATLAKLTFLDKNGHPRDLVLGFDDVDGYKRDKVSMGRTVGRVANRIKNGTFKFLGRDVELEKNCGKHFIHGGSNGIGNKEWEVVRHCPQSVSLSIDIDEADDGLPGNARIDVTYTVNDRNQLIIEHYATCKKAGILALTNHTYWSLDGAKTIHDVNLEVDAAAYVDVDEDGCPNGNILPVEGTIYDFRKGRKLGDIQDEKSIISIDNDLIITKREDHPSIPTNHLRLWSDISGIEMTIHTSYPTIHLYTAEHLDNIDGKHARIYGCNEALAIEPQFHSAAPNFENFPDITIRPGDQYSHEIVYTFDNFLSK